MAAVADILQAHPMPIVWDDKILRPSDYIEFWRLSLWQQAYLAFLSPNCNPKFTRATDLQKFDNGKLAINLLVYR